MSIRPSTSPGAVVSVTFDPKQRTVELDPPRTCIEPGATVKWRFAGLPEGLFALIRFKGGVSPFETLCLSRGEIAGVAGAGGFGDFGYEVVLVPVEGEALLVPAGGAGVVCVPLIAQLDEPPDDGTSP